METLLSPRIWPVYSVLRTLNNRPSAPPELTAGTESQGTLNTNNQAQRYTSHMYQLYSELSTLHLPNVFRSRPPNKFSNLICLELKVTLI